MKQTDEQLMLEAIALSERSKPFADRIPRVGAVIAVDGVIIGQGQREMATRTIMLRRSR
jgi:pyrimidine deaminase RibD-like protein